MSRIHVVVVGAGIIGASTAIALLQSGFDVTLVEPGEPGGRQAASYGNGGWISPASVIPMSVPGLLRRVPGYLLDPTGPLTIRPRALPELAPWLFSFLRAGSNFRKVERTAMALNHLLARAPERHRALAALVGADHLIRSNGLLYAYPDRAAFERDRIPWAIRAACGVKYETVNGVDVQALASNVPAAYTFGAYVSAGAHCINPGAYVASLIGYARSRGAHLVRATATGFEVANGRLAAVKLADGAVRCEKAVVAAGYGSGCLAREAGDRVPLASERGYHISVERSGIDLPIPFMPSDGRMGITAMDDGIRFSGQVELAGRNDPPDWRRADVLLAHAVRLFGDRIGSMGQRRIFRWMGNRPSIADGRPVIGTTKLSEDIVLAFGHGHIGLASAPATAEFVTNIFLRQTQPPVAYSPRRFD